MQHIIRDVINLGVTIDSHHLRGVIASGCLPVVKLRKTRLEHKATRNLAQERPRVLGGAPQPHAGLRVQSRHQLSRVAGGILRQNSGGGQMVVQSRLQGGKAVDVAAETQSFRGVLQVAVLVAIVAQRGHIGALCAQPFLLRSYLAGARPPRGWRGPPCHPKQHRSLAEARLADGRRGQRRHKTTDGSRSDPHDEHVEGGGATAAAVAAAALRGSRRRAAGPTAAAKGTDNIARRERHWSFGEGDAGL